MSRKSASKKTWAIRRATPEDARTIHRLVLGLARYERLARTVRATARGLARDGFGPKPRFEALLAERGGRAVGLALYSFLYSTFAGRPTLWLEDLFVVPTERGRGIGLGLLRAVGAIAVARGCGRMEWAVLDWNAPSIAFYEGLGARLRREWVLTRLEGAALRRLAVPKPGVGARAVPGPSGGSPPRTADTATHDAPEGRPRRSVSSAPSQAPARPRVSRGRPARRSR